MQPTIQSNLTATNQAQSHSLNPLFFALIAALTFILFSLHFRPIHPIDETRYISVAWEMFNNQNWLVPFKNGEPYSHKPPLMFWLINLVWLIFGVSDWAARVVIPIISMLNLLLVGLLAKKIYPKSSVNVHFSAVYLLSLTGWLLYSSLLMFDLLLTVFVLTFALSFFNFAETTHKRWLILSGLSIGLGILTKGPVILVYVTPLILLAKFWRRAHMLPGIKIIKWGFLPIAIGIITALCWAIPASIAGGNAYAEAIFWGQSAGRINHSFAHARPIYWYFIVLPVLLMPWLTLAGFWRQKPWQALTQGDKLCLVWFTSVLFLFSLISGKQIHYLLPVFPLVAIWLSARLSPLQFERREPILAIILLILSIAMLLYPMWISKAFRTTAVDSLSSWLALIPFVCACLLLIPNALKQYRVYLCVLSLPLTIITLVVFLSPVLKNVYDVKQIGQQIQQLQKENRQVSYSGRYHNTFGFAGRLTEPLEEISLFKPAGLNHLTEHSSDYTLVTVKRPNQYMYQNALFYQPYRGKILFIIENRNLLHAIKQNLIAVEKNNRSGPSG